MSDIVHVISNYVVMTTQFWENESKYDRTHNLGGSG